jgi:hypothetical protein
MIFVLIADSLVEELDTLAYVGDGENMLALLGNPRHYF